MESIVDKTETQIGVAEEALKEKWIKELEIYCKLKSAFILEGDVFDKRACVDSDGMALLPLNGL